MRSWPLKKWLQPVISATTKVILIPFVVAEIFFKEAVITSSVAKITFVVAEITFKVDVITSAVH